MGLRLVMAPQRRVRSGDGNSAAAGKRKFTDVFLSLYEVYVSAQDRIHV